VAYTGLAICEAPVQMAGISSSSSSSTTKVSEKRKASTQDDLSDVDKQRLKVEDARKAVEESTRKIGLLQLGVAKGMALKSLLKMREERLRDIEEVLGA
jgi:hypothetical protein